MYRYKIVTLYSTAATLSMQIVLTVHVRLHWFVTIIPQVACCVPSRRFDCHIGSCPSHITMRCKKYEKPNRLPRGTLIPLRTLRCESGEESSQKARSLPWYLPRISLAPSDLIQGIVNIFLSNLIEVKHCLAYFHSS